METHKATPAEVAQTSSWGTWSKTPSTFEYSYDSTETCYILEGEAEVTDKAGNKISFKAGDWVIFHTDLECTWHIIKTIKKKYNFS